MFDWLFGGDKTSPAPASRVRFSTEDEEKRCAAEIDRLVDDFVKKSRSRGSLGIQLKTFSEKIGSQGKADRFYLSPSGRGWWYKVGGSCLLYVTNDGNWEFQTYHTWGKMRNKPEDVSGWRISRGNPWPTIAPYEINNVCDEGYANATSALAVFKQAIEYWEGLRRRKN